MKRYKKVYVASDLRNVHAEDWKGSFDVLKISSLQNWEAVFVEKRKGATWYYEVRPRSTKPPRAAKFFLLLVPIRTREHVMGDIEEEFNTVLIPEYGLLLARFYYWWHVFLEVAGSVFGAMQNLAGVNPAKGATEK